MTIDGIKSFTKKDGSIGYEVFSISDCNKPNLTGLWFYSGRWYGNNPPVLGAPVRYIPGKFSMLAIED